jgi:type III secretion protein D
MASHHSKRLRVLSGRHAGASLELLAGEHSIGADHDNDITITDWTAPTLVMRVPALGDLDGAVDEAHAADDLRDLRPARFGDIVVCIGPAEGDWPSDVELLARLFEPPSVPVAPTEPSPPPRQRRTAAYAASGSVAALVACCLVAVMVQARPQLSSQAPDRLALASQSVRRALNHTGAGGLQVRVDAGAICIDGLTETRAQSRAVLAAVAELPLAAELRPRFAVVEDVVESIRSSVGLAQAQITHLGGGVFTFQGESVDPESTRAAVARVAADLAPSVKRIEVAVSRTETAHKSISVLSSFSDGDVSIVQTRDGAKHFVITSAEQPAITTP